MPVVIDLAELVNESENDLRKSEKLVADAILRDLSFAAKASTNELANRAGVSTASVTRLCQALGFGNLKQLKICIAQNEMVANRTMRRDITDPSSLPEVMTWIAGKLANGLTDLGFELSSEELARAITALQSSDQVLVLSVEKSTDYLAEIACNRLLQAGYFASGYTQSSDLQSAILLARPKAAFLIFARSRIAENSSALLSLIHERPHPAILIAAPIPSAQEASYISLAIGGESAAEGQSETLREIRYLAVLEMLVASLSMQIPDLNEGPTSLGLSNRPTPAKR